MQTFWMLVAFMPCLKETVLLLIIFLILHFSRKVPWYQNLTRAIFYTSLICFSGYLTHDLLSHWRFLLLWIFYALLALGAGLVLKKGSLRIQKLFLPLVIGLHLLFFWQFTHVERPVTFKATFDIEEGTDKVHFYFLKHCSGIESKSLIEYLRAKKRNEVELTKFATYHFGVMAGYDGPAVDGRRFQEVYSWSGGSCSLAGPTPYPQIYLGMKGFTF